MQVQKPESISAPDELSTEALELLTVGLEMYYLKSLDQLKWERDCAAKKDKPPVQAKINRLKSVREEAYRILTKGTRED